VKLHEKVEQAGSFKALFASMKREGLRIGEEMERYFAQENDLFRLIGLKIKEVREGYSELSFKFNRYASGRDGDPRVAGGVIMFALDMAGTLAVMTLNGTKEQVTLEMKTNFLNPLKEDPFRVSAKVLKTGRSILVVQGEVTDSRGNLCATSLGTWYIK
jgi:uncharacterized protein (TIGR00369 family)